MSKYDALWAYIQGRNEETLVLSFADIAQIAGTPLEQRSYFIYDTIVDEHVRSSKTAPLLSGTR